MEQIPITVVQYDNSHIQNVMQTWVMSKPATMWKQKITHNRHIFHIYLGCSHWPQEVYKNITGYCWAVFMHSSNSIKVIKAKN